MPKETTTLTQIADAFLTSFWEGDWETAALRVTPDFTWENRPAEGVLLDFKKMVEVAKAFSQGKNGYPVVELGHHHIISAVETVDLLAQERVDVWQARGKWFHLPCAGIWRFRGGSICAWTDYFDMARIAAYKSGELKGEDEAWGG